MKSTSKELIRLEQTPFPLAKPPWTKLGKKLESMCRKALFDFQLLENVDKLAIALSGGKDSLSLLFLLKAIIGRGTPPIDLYAIHIDGELSCGAGVQKAFLEGICKALDVPLLLYRQEKPQQECYSCSRERRRLLFQAAREVGASTIAFGHHRDDSIETLLMNLLHKGEFAANLPKVTMHHYGVTLIRPLIYIAEEELRSFAKLHGFARITCQCPIGQRSMRKKTAHLVEQLEQLFPHARVNLASAGLLYGSKKAERP